MQCIGKMPVNIYCILKLVEMCVCHLLQCRELGAVLAPCGVKSRAWPETMVPSGEPPTPDSAVAFQILDNAAEHRQCLCCIFGL